MDGEQWFKYYSENLPSRNKFEQPGLKYKDFPEVTLDGSTESRLAKSSIPVLLQQTYIGKRPVIKSSLADRSCKELGVNKLLKLLNTILRTESHTLDTVSSILSERKVKPQLNPTSAYPLLGGFITNATLGTEESYTLDTASTHSHCLKKHLPGFILSELESRPQQNTTSASHLLDDCIRNGYDFGTAYAYLRPYWHSGMDAKAVAKELKDRETLDWKMRRNVLVDNKIINPQVPPRRVWDLYSNRVVPWWVARRHPQPISHAWMAESDCMYVCTPINGLEWPVYIPKDANLDLIRIEMLNMGAEYAWLDILCLRLEGGCRNDLRAEEWKLDIPTLGNMFIDVRAVCYLSGLGRPFSFKEGDFESDRSWFRRAWTLQEASINPIIGGDDGTMQEEVGRKYRDELSTLETISRSHVLIELDTDVFNPLSHMRNRVSSRHVDKVAALLYLLYSREIPVYDETQSVEDAWIALVNVMQLGNRGQLFFRYPEPGNADKSWRPSWHQVEEVLPPPDRSWWDEHVYRDEETDADLYYGPCIESAFVRGLDKRSAQQELRWGKLVVEDGNGEKHEFRIVADHQYCIQDSWYTLLGCKPTLPGEDKKQYWVVGKRPEASAQGEISEPLSFTKKSIFRIPDTEEAERLHKLGIVKKINNKLL